MSGIRLLLSSLNECIIKFPPSTYIILRANKTLYIHYYLLLIILSSQNGSIGYCNRKKIKVQGTSVASSDFISSKWQGWGWRKRLLNPLLELFFITMKPSLAWKKFNLTLNGVLVLQGSNHFLIFIHLFYCYKICITKFTFLIILSPF